MKCCFSQDICRTSIVAVRTQFNYNGKFPNVWYITNHAIQTTSQFSVAPSVRVCFQFTPFGIKPVKLSASVHHLQKMSSGSETSTTQLQLILLCKLPFRPWNMWYGSSLSTLFLEGMLWMSHWVHGYDYNCSLLAASTCYIRSSYSLQPFSYLPQYLFQFILSIRSVSYRNVTILTEGLKQ